MVFALLYAILIPTIIISIIALRDSEIFDKLKFNASHIYQAKEWHRFVSYGVIHADYIHLAVNMYVLWSFGKIVLYDFHILFENLANIYFLILYIPALAISVIPSYFKNRNNYHYNAVGASGAVSAVVYAAIILNPTIGMGLIFIPFMLPAWVFGLLYLIYTIVMGRKGNSTIGHSAHLWGALYGMFIILLFEPKLYLYFYYSILG